ncbi:MAG: dihydroneopterin aldolase [Acidimicrobiia bacterium]|nr:dihydroneopterin aldolase [Acidimicrobiia bacterium]
MSDLIQIRGLELLLFCGVLPEETVRRQPFRLDIDIEVDLEQASRTDNLTDTVNYGDVLDQLSKALQSERFDLLERLAGRTAELVLANPLATAVTVSAHKLRPPVPQHVESTGVKIRRER